jgi:predicted O-methyltransferase YrrM
MRPEELNTGFEKVARLYPGKTPAALAQRERIFLYALVYSLSPRYSLEIGTWKGGSAYIISGALDDIQTGGRLLCLEPYPERVEVDLAEIQHNVTVHRGFFPVGMPSEFDGHPTGQLFDFCFLDADHRYDPVLAYCEDLTHFMRKDGYILCHDAYNQETKQALQKACDVFGYVDCGLISRCCNDEDPNQLYGGFQLLMATDATVGVASRRK